MPDGQRGSAYSQALTAVGGVTPYTWSLAGGALPADLTLDSLGDITGKPTTLGTFTFTACVTDSASNAVTKALAITVVSPTLTIATPTPGRHGWHKLFGNAHRHGRDAALHLSLTWGAPPPGLNLTSAGVVSGTPRTAARSVHRAGDRQRQRTAQELFTVAIQNNARSSACKAIPMASSSCSSPATPARTTHRILGQPGGLGKRALHEFARHAFSWADTNAVNDTSHFYVCGLSRKL